MRTAHLAAGQRQRVAASFARDAEVRAGLPPLGTVGGDAAFFRAGLGDQMCEFVAQRALGLAGKVAQARVEKHLRGGGSREAGGAGEAGVPADGDPGGEVVAADGAQQVGGGAGERGVAGRRRRRRGDLEERKKWPKCSHRRTVLRVTLRTIARAMENDPPNPPDAEDWWGRGERFRQAGRWEEAAGCFQRIVEAEHGNGAAMAAWGEALRGAKRKREAVAVLRQARTLRPEDAGLCRALGEAWQELGHPREALPVYAEACRMDPESAQGWYGAGCAHLASGEFAAAARCQREALRRAPGWGAARHNLGSALFKLGEVDAALEAFAEAARGPEPGMSLAMSALIVPGSPRAGNAEILEARRKWVDHVGAGGSPASRDQRSDAVYRYREVCLRPSRRPGFRPRSRTRSAQDDSGRKA